MPDHTIDPILRYAARGAVSNAQSRFDRLARRYETDGWECETEEVPLRTELRQEESRRIITYNRSPDLPFDRSINPYRGCEHGCIYCFARPTHAFLGLSPGLDFETRLIARPNAPELLDKELRARAYRVAPIAIGTNTDPYQPMEKTQRVARNCLKVLREFNHPVMIVTKGTLIERDLDILGPMAEKGLVKVGVSVTTLDPELARRMEPRVPGPARRLETIRRLRAEGIPVRIMTSPLIPALNDHELEALLAAGAEAGAQSASWIMLRLPLEVSPLFKEWLEAHYPDRAARIMGHVRDMHGGREYDAQWGRRMRGNGPYAEMIAARFKRAVRKLGLDRPQANLRNDLFQIPVGTGEQLSLF